ncbi:MAG: WbuC family cupin fold metalloprotein [Bacteroidota bacterium]
MKIIDNQRLDSLSEEAKLSKRLRKNLNLHTESVDPIQRLLNALEPDTYICPHKHENPDKRELFMLIRGNLSVLIFNDLGEIEHAFRLSNNSNCKIVEIESRKWHSVVCHEPGTIYFELKDGPYDPDNDKNFAPWAPAEFDLNSVDYLIQLKMKISKIESAQII